MRFSVFADDTMIGWSELEHGDPPMGVAFGRFFPSESYDRSRHTSPESMLQVSPEGSAVYLAASGGIHIADFSSDLGPDGIEISVLGIQAESYAYFFAHHVRAYDEQFPARERAE